MRTRYPPGAPGFPVGRAGHRAGVAANQPQEDDDMTTARDLMTPGAECVGENESLADAARKMRDLNVGALPICGSDNRLKGMLTDRDIVVKCVADGGDPNKTTAGAFAQGKPVTIGADDSIDAAVRTMETHQVRRRPVE